MTETTNESLTGFSYFKDQVINCNAGEIDLIHASIKLTDFIEALNIDRVNNVTAFTVFSTRLEAMSVETGSSSDRVAFFTFKVDDYLEALRVNTVENNLVKIRKG